MLKRAIPFILTFILGLAIASIFVSVKPNFNFKRGDRHRNHRQIVSELELENDQLRIENQRLRSGQFGEMDTLMHIDELGDIEQIVPAPMPIQPRRSR
jgi:hypothetical protein